MDQDRVVRVWALITEHAQREGASASLRHVCVVCARAVAATGSGLSITRGRGRHDPVATSDAASAELAELQFTLGEGPSADALDGAGPVLAADLSAAASRRRWPVFAPAATKRGVLAMFSFPLELGAVRVGVLDLYRDRTGPLSGAQLADALVFADAALLLVLDDRGGIPAAYADLVDGGFDEWRAEVHQAAGMLSVQLGVEVEEALVRLRAYAFTQDRRLAAVARDVIERRVRFDGGRAGKLPEGGNEPDGEEN
ncbi:ANTAR domain-containing protein [Actinophytocola sp.]|uniref:ANTAR domain-containing protein n=1 Tax=Actinophytocola sp. TaxID=1872138 RepID=UPI002D7FA01C|nr:ANTAR domain-containing protein [Actinophytocola sp.]HET9138222.1 ANTAR domain-containing protein [Actinophytocola sp.]